MYSPPSLSWMSLICKGEEGIWRWGCREGVMERGGKEMEGMERGSYGEGGYGDGV